MKALILAAGYATRLYPLTKDYPKPLLKLKDKPIIDYIIEKLDNIFQINEIIVVTNNKFISYFRKWKEGLKIVKHLSLVDDLTKTPSERRGAVGDIKFVIDKKRIREDLLIIGGDNLFDDDLGDFLTFAKIHEKNPVVGAYNIRKKVDAKKYGVIKLDRKNKVIDFQEKPKNPKSTLVAMCLYYFPKERLSLIREYFNIKNKKSDAMGMYIDWLRRKVQVFGFIFNGQWYDIGDHKFYNLAKQEFN